MATSITFLHQLHVLVQFLVTVIVEVSSQMPVAVLEFPGVALFYSRDSKSSGAPPFNCHCSKVLKYCPLSMCRNMFMPAVTGDTGFIIEN